MTRAIVLHSGGLDSTVCLAKAIAEHDASEVIAVSIAYGQRHVRELQSARNLADYYGINRVEVDLPDEIFVGHGSALIPSDEVVMPKMTYEELAESEGPSPTYVPYRNGIFISVAAAIALTMGAGEVWMGAHAEDARGFAYPDCTPEWLGAQSAALYIGTYHAVRLVTPWQWLSKSDVVAEGVALNVPFELTWSCYEGGEEACGVCPTCVGRIEAFAECGLLDPIGYAGHATAALAS